jgi:acetyl esterase/lipase
MFSAMKKFILMLMLGSAAMAQEVLPLWSGNMPGKATSEEEGVDTRKNDGVLRIKNVSKPTLTLYLLEDRTEPAPFVIVCPGGGYNILAFDKEGTEVAEWLNSIGISAAILKYRVPKNREGALEDARKAVRTAREKTQEWNIDPERIGMLGFSAGGHLTAACSGSPDRPDFSILVYPAYLFNEGGLELIDEITVDADTPPAFVVQTRDDKKYYRSSLAYASALDAQGVACEVHLFMKGGHGYGLRPTEHPVGQWPQLCAAWMREMGFLE